MIIRRHGFCRLAGKWFGRGCIFVFVLIARYCFCFRSSPLMVSCPTQRYETGSVFGERCLGFGFCLISIVSDICRKCIMSYIRYVIQTVLAFVLHDIQPHDWWIFEIVISLESDPENNRWVRYNRLALKWAGLWMYRMFYWPVVFLLPTYSVLYCTLDPKVEQTRSRAKAG